MKLMPKTLRKNSGSTSLYTARERVRDSWRVLKQSIYYFSSNTKAKDSRNDRKKNSKSSSEDVNSNALDICTSSVRDLELSEEYDVESVIMKNVNSLLSDSEEYDEIGELLKAYKRELKAYNKIKSKISDDVFYSDTSEISSISDLSLSSDSENGSQGTITTGCGTQTPDLLDKFHLRNDLSKSTVVTDKESNITPERASSSGKSCSSSSTLSITQSPEIEIVKGLHIPPPERAKAIFKPLPSLMKPSYIPNLSSFDQWGLDNVNVTETYSVDIANGKYKDSVNKNVLPDNSELNARNNNLTSTCQSKVDLESHPGDDSRLTHTLPKCSSSKDHGKLALAGDIEELNTAIGPKHTDNRILHSTPDEIDKIRSTPDIFKTLSEVFNLDSALDTSSKTQFSSGSLFDSEAFLNKLSRSSDTIQEEGVLKTSVPLPSRYVQNNTDTNSEESDSVSVIDENYFIVRPDAKDEVSCGNPRCQNQTITVKKDSVKYTSCPSCFVCYCSRACRHKHWPEHKESCLVGFVNFYVHCFFRRCEKDYNFNAYLGDLARQAYLVFGRGCLAISFETPLDIKKDALSMNTCLATQPIYKDLNKVISENKLNRHLHMLCQNIKDYDPDQEFVLNIFVWIGNPVPELKLCTAVVRSARISSLHFDNPDYGDSTLSYSIRKFRLPSFLPSMHTDIETRRYYCKEVAFGLKRYGVHLKSEYPDAYEKLYRYIDQEILFDPLILYGKRNDRNYKCILTSGRLKQVENFCGEGTFV